MGSLRVVIVLLIVVLSLLFFFNSDYFSLDYLQRNKRLFVSLYEQNTLLFLTGMFLLFVISSSAPVPIASILCIICGALMGQFYGLLFVSFATAIGSTLTFFFTRSLFSELIKRRYSSQIQMLFSRTHPEDFMHAASVRLVPFLPFFIVNYIMSLSSISLTKFYLSTQLGMLFFVSLLVNAGVQFEKIQSVNQVFTPNVMLSALSLIVAPILLRALFRVWGR